ncbi:glycosyltransferase family 4 protein [Actinomadura sp. HBU206391]|uniref:glycosyltransferase family 4 protein n=1 Tax=Actinomadura sp. HBU206391 TaxID=2731692 RepID=UPI00290590AA|nr:glycosyltransferase family 4 protein [Actinomadura sp. HBU206391]
MLEKTRPRARRHRFRLVVFVIGLGVRQLRDDPARALRLGVRLTRRFMPGPARRRLAALAVPRPRDPRREVADLRALLRLRRDHAVVDHTGVDHTGVDQAAAGAARPRDAVEVPVVEGRVLQLVTNALPRTNAGYTVRTHKIALAQRELGLDPHVVSRLGHPAAQGVADARSYVEVDGVPYHRLLPWLPPRDLAAAVRAGADHAGRLVERLRPAVLHPVSNHLNAAVALELRERYGLPVVYEVRGFLEDSWLSRDPAHSEQDDFYRLTRELETRCIQEADRVVTLGEAMRDEIAGRGVDPEKIVVVPNAVDDTFLEPLPDGTALRASLGIAPDAMVTGLTSSFYGYEGIDTLIDAAGLLRDRGTPITLLLVGDGPERAALERRATEQRVHAVFTGRVPMSSVRQFHAVLDLFAVPRRADRVCQLVTPLKPVEAMAGGVPVIASDVKALREIVEPGVTGTLTLPEDPEAWAQLLTDLIYSPEQRRKIGEAAQDWVRARRTWRAVATGYLKAYRDVG